MKFKSEYINCFSNLIWGRLHAQPGAPILVNGSNYDMYSLASTFEDFYRNSITNLNKEPYPGTLDYSYASIYHNDKTMMAKTMEHFAKVSQLISSHRHRRSR